MKKKKPGLFLISVGDELLDGRTPNTNASFFGDKCREAGIQVAEIRTVSDRPEDIIRALKDANAYAMVFLTGGLGPTNDDRTSEAAAKAFRLPWQMNKAAEKIIREKYAKRNVEITPIRLRQARLPKGAKLLPNPNGIAPAFSCVFKGTNYFFAPGVPSECRPIFIDKIIPIAAKKLGHKKLLRRDFWRTFGAGESDIYQKISPIVDTLEKKFPASVVVGVHISFPCVDISLEYWQMAGEAKPSKTEQEKIEAEISKVLGDLCFTRERKTLVEVVAAELEKNSATLATAESCTGGWVGKLLTDLPGASAFYLGSVVSYANSAKTKILNVSEKSLQNQGAVSDAVVREMAENSRKLFGTTYAIALSGISGPSGGTSAKPVGTIHVALAGPQRTDSVHQVIFGGQLSREQNRFISAHLALNLLRLTMKRVD